MATFAPVRKTVPCPHVSRFGTLACRSRVDVVFGQIVAAIALFVEWGAVPVICYVYLVQVDEMKRNEVNFVITHP